MKKILLVQFRTKDEIAVHERTCILSKIKGSGGLKTVNVFQENFDFSLDNLSRFSKIILGGSGEFDFSKKEKSPDLWQKVKKTIPFIKIGIKKNIPILGICFGYHYLAYILGSEIIRDNSQKEVGTFKISLTQLGKSDPLFSSLPSQFLVQQGHKDSLRKLPQGALLLAKGRKCKIQSFRFKNSYGVQFHPELNVRDVKFRAKIYPHIPGNKRLNLKPSPLTKKVLNNFLNL